VIIAELHLPPPIGFELLNADRDANPSVYVVGLLVSGSER